MVFSIVSFFEYGVDVWFDVVETTMYLYLFTIRQFHEYLDSFKQIKRV